MVELDDFGFEFMFDLLVIFLIVVLYIDIMK